jgi:hypothetical protein
MPRVRTLVTSYTHRPTRMSGIVPRHCHYRAMPFSRAFPGGASRRREIWRWCGGVGGGGCCRALMAVTVRLNWGVRLLHGRETRGGLPVRKAGFRLAFKAVA